MKIEGVWSPKLVSGRFQQKQSGLAWPSEGHEVGQAAETVLGLGWKREGMEDTRAIPLPGWSFWLPGGATSQCGGGTLFRRYSLVLFPLLAYPLGFLSYGYFSLTLQILP